MWDIHNIKFHLTHLVLVIGTRQTIDNIKKISYIKLVHNTDKIAVSEKQEDERID